MAPTAKKPSDIDIGIERKWYPRAEAILPKAERRETIISLLPSATEILFALGVGGEVVGTTHECEPLSEGRVVCTANLLPPNLTAAEIDDAVCASLASDLHTIYRLDTDAVRNLNPSVIVTQALCAVCAVPEDAVRDVACTLPALCRVATADPHTLYELFEVIENVAKVVRRPEMGRRLVWNLKDRLAEVRKLCSHVKEEDKRRVMVLEWPDPPYAPGHWVPDMIDVAGGICCLGESGQKSKRITWKEFTEAKADVIIAGFCGYDLKQNEEECDKVKTKEWLDIIDKCNTNEIEIYASNATAYYSRPGPRLIDGTELLAHILHRTPEYKPKEAGCISIRKDGKWVDLAL